MIQVLRNNTDVSGKIKGITPIEYRVNDDFTFELPEIQITTTDSGFAIGDMLTVQESAIPSNQVSFYVAKIEYDYRTKLYQLRCPHVLRKLAKYKGREISVAWSGITPTYQQYNNQSGAPQGQSFWGRRYWQVLFLMQTLIRKATGLSISAIDVAVGEKPCFYYTRSSDMFGWYTIERFYKDLGVSSESLVRLGSQTHRDYQSADFDTVYALPNCLQVLRWLCASCALTIDIFRADYQVRGIAASSAPADNDIKGKQDKALEPYRSYLTSATRLATGSFDYVYGTIDNMGLLVPYEYGTPGAAYELEQSDIEVVDAIVTEPHVLNLTYPNMFKLYFINNRGDYQSNIYYINDGENNLGWLEMWLDMIAGVWMNMGSRQVYEIILPGIQLRHRRVEIDVADRKMTYEVLS